MVAICQSNEAIGPSCEVVVEVPEGPLGDMNVTIDIVETDFSSIDEYITSITAGPKVIATDLLKSYEKDASQQSCGIYRRILNSTRLPLASVTTSFRRDPVTSELQTVRVVRINIKTSSKVGGNNVCGFTLHGRVRLQLTCAQL